MSSSVLHLKKSALLLIDLQRGIVSRALAPYPPSEVIERCAKLAAAYRANGMPVVYVRVDLADLLDLPIDKPSHDPGAPPPPDQDSELVHECGYKEGDLLITKRQWGAFYDTGLDQQLRRRDISTIVIGGIATNFGVESTAREGFDRGYQMVFVEDSMTSITAEAHSFVVENIFPSMGRVRTSNDIFDALA